MVDAPPYQPITDETGSHTLPQGTRTGGPGKPPIRMSRSVTGAAVRTSRPAAALLDTGSLPANRLGSTCVDVTP